MFHQNNLKCANYHDKAKIPSADMKTSSEEQAPTSQEKLKKLVVFLPLI